MQEICFITGVSGEQWAAWVQALGSIAAIGGSFWLARKFQIDELKRLELAHAAQTQLAHELQLADLRRKEIADAKLNIQRCSQGLYAIRFIEALVNAIVDLNPQKAFSEQEVRTMDAAFAVPLQALSNIPLNELPHKGSAFILMGLSLQISSALNDARTSETPGKELQDIRDTLKDAAKTITGFVRELEASMA